jgi:5-formyltetrahydrofolate cyclo-ligase
MSPGKVAENSLAVCNHLSNWDFFQQAKTILSFLAFRNEINLSRLFTMWPNKLWLVPRVVEGQELEPDQNPFLVLHPYDPTRLVRHRFGMLEPEPSLPIVDPGKVEIALVPGVAFDRSGGRLGYGGGFYDGLLPLVSRGVFVGVTYDELVVNAIPMEPWDCRVEWVVTASALIRIRQE